ncbi:hypothetical protein B0I72DRAFT_96941 [Yarrowia lipolytica]|uniref:YALI0C12364p n=2 Tax=Yarrowia lipolytica TaxID=4952 RepID=Q6CC55_YARLI|nr:YALI0C12364p [Yarrowia lipolytica CLIB122]RDW27907.1 hypothetical protein B0I71DRAFT_93345 [Yarrowia lipolytica]RDW32841.1 hypothetical protein B0I72DRAFT_96941 [Yarrowia lipolytica]RDW37597.1 hypothetical protein B0I73DRAFT_122989 [Yarrowia lipolytica]RDW47879.1 hypothetical protein B0I74DRAFT_108389 [Yarrowia lipolytica]RDW55014.1 hypothetical protein B0I75DRAFT_113313 [Yarrowia lipolytica]|eukprot:XP_501757.2 YALI0C12364p [Yarrowia lipolytica CLIB122]
MCQCKPPKPHNTKHNPHKSQWMPISLSLPLHFALGQSIHSLHWKRTHTLCVKSDPCRSTVMSHTHPAATMSLKNILNDERPLPPIRYINYPPTPPMYYYQPQAQAQAQVQVQPQVVHAAAPPPPPPSAMMQVPPPPPSHVHSYAPPSLPQSPPLYQPQTVPIVNVNLNNAHNKKRKKYMCDCGRSFTTSGHLARHMRIHTGEKNYQCPYEGCTSRFSRQDNCMQHYRTHLGTSRNSMMRRKSGTVSPPPGQVSKPKQEKAVERKMSNFLSTVLVT